MGFDTLFKPLKRLIFEYTGFRETGFSDDIIKNAKHYELLYMFSIKPNIRYCKIDFWYFCEEQYKEGVTILLICCAPLTLDNLGFSGILTDFVKGVSCYRKTSYDHFKYLSRIQFLIQISGLDSDTFFQKYLSNEPIQREYIQSQLKKETIKKIGTEESLD
jgi:hypothetical protein